MKLSANISLVFDGQCEAAFTQYERCLEGRLAFVLKWGNSPAAAEAPPGWEDKVYHATLEIGESVITGGDLPPGRYVRPQGFSMVLQMNDVAAAERIFQSLAEDGKVEVPLSQTFWAERFAVVVDRFGVPWTVNCEKEQ